MSQRSSSTITKTPTVVVAFDLYGTILSTESIASTLAHYVGDDKARAVAATWRTLQLEYTWRLNSMKQYVPFSTVTERALLNAARAHSARLQEAQVSSLMRAYNSLSTFPDVSLALSKIAADESIRAVVFSNGTHSMVSNSVSRSSELSPYAHIFKDLISVEDVKAYKPDPEVYKHLAKAVGKTDEMGELWLVSGNPFDVVGAAACGMKTVWVDRRGVGWSDELIEGEAGKPTAIVKDLLGVVEAIKRDLGQKSPESA